MDLELRKTNKQEQRPANSTYTQVGVSCFYESEVLNQSPILLMKFSTKKPHLRVAAKRYLQPYERPYQQKRDKQKE